MAARSKQTTKKSNGNGRSASAENESPITQVTSQVGSAINNADWKGIGVGAVAGALAGAAAAVALSNESTRKKMSGVINNLMKESTEAKDAVQKVVTENKAGIMKGVQEIVKDSATAAMENRSSRSGTAARSSR